MALIVMKFGGTSVGSPDRVRQAAQIVADCSREHRVAVVVSAFSGVTDAIIETVNVALTGDMPNAQLGKLEDRHHSAIAELFPASKRAAVEKEIDAVLRRFREFCSALTLLRSATPQVMDVALAVGERISAPIVAAYLHELGVQGEYVDSARVLITDDKFGNASPAMDATRHQSQQVLLPSLGAARVPVVTGYAGVTANGRPTTLGRGGSDFSATILGAAIGADEIWIWTDVDGVLNADPRVCPRASTLPEITYAEAIELSYYGAKVIHPKAIRPAMDLGIPVWIKNSFAPRVPGTKIASSVHPSHSPVKAVSVVTKASLVTLSTRQNHDSAEIFGRLFLRLGHEHVDVLFSTQSSSENALGLVLRQENTDHVVQIIKRLFRNELKHGVLNPISVQDDVAVVAVLGQSMKGYYGVIGRLFSAVGRRKVSVIAVAQGASEINICFAVPAKHAQDTVRAVHDEFFAPAQAYAMVQGVESQG
ncbi:MAG: aspartate kinase [Acidobacteriaceae bacterium]|nr:aspartate kinase [Acidobacteriaceae bacterium]